MDDLLSLVSRWFHILAAITAVGGTIFARFVVLPSLETLEPSLRDALHAQIRARWSKIVAAAIGLLLISGLYNIAMIEMKTTVGRDYPWYRPLFGVKFLLALVIFTLASLLSGKTAAAQRLRQNARFWMNVNIVLAVAVVCISGFLRTAVKHQKITTDAPRASTLVSPPGRASQATRLTSDPTASDL